MALSRILNGGVSSSALPSGTVIQVKYTQFTGTNSLVVTTGSNSIFFSDLTVNITPTSTSSIIKIEAQVYGEWDPQPAATNSSVFFLRDSTKLGHTGADNRSQGIGMMYTSYHTNDSNSTPEGSSTFQYYDTPATTSQITYKLAVTTGSGSNPTFYLNRTKGDTNDSSYERFISSISATEIAG